MVTRTLTPAAAEKSTGTAQPAHGQPAYIRTPGDNTPLVGVDVAIVMESTYPFLKGGVSAVVHDIVTHNPDLSFGIIHIAWDSHAPQEDLYDMPPNVRWVDLTYLSLEENRQEFINAVTNPPAGVEHITTTELLDALRACGQGNPQPLWEIYRTGANPLTATKTVWPVLQTQQFMDAALSLADTTPTAGGENPHTSAAEDESVNDVTVGELFWAVRDLFSLAYSLCSRTYPAANVYHAHTTGYASFVAAAAAQQHHGSFLLTEHNLYVRDTVNTLIGRRMDLPVTLNSPHELGTTTIEKLWIRWWTDMGAFLYPSADHITYLYPAAIEEAAALGGDASKSEVLPNGMVWEEFTVGRKKRARALKDIQAGTHGTWRFACIARVVPIKGILELIDTAHTLIQAGHTNFTIDVLGPTEHVPDYYEACVKHVHDLGLEDVVFLRGTVKVRDVLHDYDALVLSSFNEGQPVVVLESMACGLPVIGTDVGGMDQVVRDPLTDTDGTTVGPCGKLVEPGDTDALAAGIAELMTDTDTYAQWAENSLARLKSTFLMPTIMHRYNAIYRRLGAGTTHHGGAPTPTGSADLGRGKTDITTRANNAEHTCNATPGLFTTNPNTPPINPHVPTTTPTTSSGRMEKLLATAHPAPLMRRLIGGGYHPRLAK